MDQSEEVCEYCVPDEPEAQGLICGAPATWVADDGTYLCDRHMAVVAKEQPDREFDPLPEP